MLQWVDMAKMGPLWTRLWVYGASGSGKTVCGATFPQPFFALVHNENSEVSIRGMNIRGVKIGVPPAGSRADYIAPARNDIDELLNALLSAKARNTLYTDFGQTLVVDNMTHLNDLVVADIASLKMGSDDKPGQMHKQKWGVLRNFYMHLRDVLWSLPMHVVFVSHASVHRDAANNVLGAGPSVQGQGAELLPGSCDALGYCEQLPTGARVVHFQKQGLWPARHRYIGVGPGPFPNHQLWQVFAAALGHAG